MKTEHERDEEKRQLEATGKKLSLVMIPMGFFAALLQIPAGKADQAWQFVVAGFVFAGLLRLVCR